MTKIERATNETTVRVRLATAGGAVEVATSDPFLDHMVNTLARYAGLGLHVDAQGDLRHHLIEDVAITIGLALRDELPESCPRYGHAHVPMDDALVAATLDVGGRAYYEGPLPSRLYDHFMRSLADNALATLHIQVQRGRDRHHVVEAAFKAVGLALRQAIGRPGSGVDGGGAGAGVDGGGAGVGGGGVFSTKGAVRIERSTQPDA